MKILKVIAVMSMALLSYTSMAQNAWRMDSGRRAPMMSAARTYRVGVIRSPRFEVQPGPQQIAELAAMFTDGSSLEFNFTSGYRFNDWFFLGGGTGFAYSFSDSYSFIPAYVSPVFYLSDRRVAPVVGIKTGAIFALPDESKDGEVFPLIDIKPGIRIHLNGGNDLNISLNIGPRPYVYYDYVGYSYDYDDPEYDIYMAGGISVGFSF